MIERGRWLNILSRDRLCTLCNNLIDEFHVICGCPRYDPAFNSQDELLPARPVIHRQTSAREQRR